MQYCIYFTHSDGKHGIFLRTNLLEKRFLQNEDRKASTSTKVEFRQAFILELPLQNKNFCDGERHLIIVQKTPTHKENVFEMTAGKKSIVYE